MGVSLSEAVLSISLSLSLSLSLSRWLSCYTNAVKCSLMSENLIYLKLIDSTELENASKT